MSQPDLDSQIVSRLKDPWKFVFVDMDIAVLCSGLGFTLMLSEINTLIAMAAAGSVGFYLHKSRQDKPPGYLAHKAYWYFPQGVLGLKRVPPQYCLYTVG